MARRQVGLKGDWGLFIEFAEWQVTTAHSATNSEVESEDWWKPWLDDISGQRLVSVESVKPGWLTLHFDLGGIVEIWPTTDIDNDVWTLHIWDGDIIVCRHDGELDTEVHTAREAAT